MNQLLSHVDVAVVAGLTYYLVQTALKPLVARFVAHATGVAFDAIVPLLLVIVAGGLICLDVWAPVAFQVAEMAVGIATMSVGGYRISQNQMPTKRQKTPPQAVKHDLITGVQTPVEPPATV